MDEALKKRCIRRLLQGGTCIEEGIKYPCKECKQALKEAEKDG